MWRPIPAPRPRHCDKRVRWLKKSSLVGPKAFNEAWWGYWGVFEATHFGQHLEQWRDQMHPTLVTAMEEGLAMSAVDLMKAETAYTEAWEKLRPILERCDALLCPTESIPAPAVDYDELGAIAVDEQGRFLSMDMTMQFKRIEAAGAFGYLQASLKTGCRPAYRSSGAGSMTSRCCKSVRQWSAHFRGMSAARLFDCSIPRLDNTCAYLKSWHVRFCSKQK